jgi:hypothetical protein
MLCKSYSFTFDYLQKNFEEDLQKNLQKQNMWCKRGPKCQKIEETIHAYLISIYIGSIPSNLCTYKQVQLCTSICALVCVGINHQKGGD